MHPKRNTCKRAVVLEMTELPSVDNVICILQKCRKLKNLAFAKRVHAHICNNGLESHVAIGNHVVPMFVECGSVSDAQQVFNKLAHRNVHSWTSLILGYVDCGHLQHAFNLYQKMQEDSVSPSSYTFVALLKACARLKDIKTGRYLHVKIMQNGFERVVFVGSALVDMYAKCGSLYEAWEVFCQLPVRNVVSWSALIAGYAEHGHGLEALNCFERMQFEGISPNAVTFVSALKACGSIRAIDKGREMHANLTQQGFEKHLFIGSTLVDMYAKCGSLSEAQEVLNQLPVRNVVSWSALIAGYAEHGPGQEALKCFVQMQLDDVVPNAHTFVSALKACGSIGAIDKGRELHADLAQKGFERDIFIGNSLIDMYGKCGSLLEAREVFDKLPARDVVSWSAMIQGYGVNNEGNMAIQCFEDMQEHGVKPVEITFTCLLSACSHCKLVHKGQEIFNLMREEYGIALTAYHYTCMVQLLAQSGHLNEAENFLANIRSPPLWRALLSACRGHGKVELGLKCFQQLVQLDPECASAYVLMANIYSSAGRCDDAYWIEELRKHTGANKKPGSAFIEVNKKVYEFVVGYNQSNEILALLEVLSSRAKEEGYVPNVNLVLSPTNDQEKELALCDNYDREHGYM